MTLRALLRLCRIPNVFTAVANVVAGVLLARGGVLRLADLVLCAASACLYLAGMVLNDYFDRDLDAVERPDRPIPSGQIAPGFALALGLALLSLGVWLAGWSSTRSAAVAGALACAILLYDGGVKGGPLGPLAMGACRFLNVCLGLSVTGAAPPEGWMWIAPITMGVYTVAITSLSRDEVAGASGARARELVLVIAGVLGGALVALCALSPARHLGGFLWLVPFAALVAWQARAAFAPLLSQASGPNIGRAIGGGILLMPALDACMVAAGGWPEAAALVAALALPALMLKRWYYMT
ncbi:MAG TPA: UbiA family prenyltransferase [Kofleriaceae bacterium]|nr:UbiA family prenyltransferase [Kofleriaceae bacterium]